MDNLEFRLSTYNFSSHIAKLEWDPWDQPVIQLRNGQSYAITISGQDPARLRNLSKSDWGDIARRIDTILTNKNIWPLGQPALPMERNYDNLVINGNGVTYAGTTYHHATATNTLLDYQAIVAAARQRLALPPSSTAPVPAALPIADPPAPLPADPRPLTAPRAQLAIGDPVINRAVTDLVEREGATIAQQNRVILPRLRALVADSFRQRVATAAQQLQAVRSSGVSPEAVVQTVNARVDGLCEQHFRTALEGDIVNLLSKGIVPQQIAQKVSVSYKLTLQGLGEVPVKARLAQLLEEATLNRIIAGCAKGRQGRFSKLKGALKSTGAAGAAIAGNGTVKLAKVVALGGLKLGSKAVVGIAKVGWRALIGQPLLGGPQPPVQAHVAQPLNW